ncbi:hypothetical protein VOLCADRAFT_103614 [Volvox carteri f. nagariensis]|uniref:Beta-Casp domain-containing protein n=1 Tax=Volvox carteri f. nagariensis TaxID=3068 RepID=D8TNC8_VOLCA|nr:uncharacterized protein VOLCADRAFT_103614 [Volvox carteri f. nagariensis]EFJ50967.1 hypothetical protein VOLCADRAFT_103614 [Volvox carteri f. nagariensis]|eukprot:XP_002947979.1 hypothetical protein VOLCADRAFT_103614 [Volvox carteri f. nagariensis]
MDLQDAAVLIAVAIIILCHLLLKVKRRGHVRRASLDVPPATGSSASSASTTGSISISRLPQAPGCGASLPRPLASSPRVNSSSIRPPRSPVAAAKLALPSPRRLQSPRQQPQPACCKVAPVSQLNVLRSPQQRLLPASCKASPLPLPPPPPRTPLQHRPFHRSEQIPKNMPLEVQKSAGCKEQAQRKEQHRELLESSQRGEGEQLGERGSAASGLSCYLSALADAGAPAGEQQMKFTTPRAVDSADPPNTCESCVSPFTILGASPSLRRANPTSVLLRAAEIEARSKSSGGANVGDESIGHRVRVSIGGGRSSCGGSSGSNSNNLDFDSIAFGGLSGSGVCSAGGGSSSSGRGSSGGGSVTMVSTSTRLFSSTGGGSSSSCCSRSNDRAGMSGKIGTSGMSFLAFARATQMDALAGSPPVSPAKADAQAEASLLQTLEIHAALISSPEALLALPYLLQPNAYDIDSYNGADNRGGSAAAAAATDSGWFPGAAWHHMGPIRGPVYSTQAALDAAEQLAAERLAAEEAAAATVSVAGPPPRRQPPPPLPRSVDLGWEPLSDAQEALLATCWRHRAPWRAVRYCLDRVRPVRYGQVVPLDSYELTAVAYSSGSGFGRAVWQIADGSERCRTVLYLPDAAAAHPFAPPMPLNLVSAPDALILGPDCLAPFPPSRPPQYHHHHHHQRVKEEVLRAVVGGGSCLIPVYPTGEAWELLEGLAGALTSADLPHVPLMYIGPRSGTSLALASVSLESLAPERQAAVYVPQHPFAFDALMQAGRLVVGSSLQDPEVQRCLAAGCPRVVALAAADSLSYRGGPALELLLRFGPDPRNLLLLPHAAPPAALRGIQRLYDKAAAAAATAAPPAQPATLGRSALPPPPPLRMRIIRAPLRGGGGSAAVPSVESASAAGPSPASIVELLSRLQPRHLLATKRDLALLRQHQQLQQLQQLQPQQHMAGGLMPAGTPSHQGTTTRELPLLPPLARETVVPYDWLHQARVTLPRNVHSAMVSSELLQRLQWLQGGPGLQLARLNCLMVFRDGAWHADPVPGGAASADSVAAAAALTAGGTVAADQLLLLAAAETSTATPGQPALGPLLEALAGHGITRVRMESAGSTDVQRVCVRVVLDDGLTELRAALRTPAISVLYREYSIPGATQLVHVGALERSPGVRTT